MRGGDRGPAGNRGGEKASWRRSGRGTPPPPTVAGRDVGHSGRGRRALLFRVSLLVTLALGLGFMLVQVLRREPARVVPLIVTAVTRSGPRLDTDPIPTMPNPYATEDVAWLSTRFGDPRASQNVRLFGRLEDQTGALSYQTEELVNGLTEALGHPSLKPGGPRGDMVAAFVTAHGMVHQGEPCLLMGDSVPEDPESWVSAESLFRAMLEATERGGSGTRVVLFLDATRGGRSWEWGVFEQDFNEGCATVLRKLGDDRLAVVVSADSGERSWIDPRAGRSLFVDSLVDVMSGGGDRNEDGELTLGEMTEFLREQVSLRAGAIWDAAQHPRLLTDWGSDWLFMHEPEPRPAPEVSPPDTADLEKSFARCETLWRRHRTLRGAPHPPLSTDPVRWAELERRLARLERLALAGRGYRDEFDNVASTCDRLLTRFEAGLPVAPGEPTERSLQRYLAGPAVTGTESEPSVDPAWRAAWDEKPVPDSVPKGITESQAVDLLVPWLESRRYDLASRGAAAALVANRFGGRTRLLETHLIRMLAAPDLRDVPAKSAASVMTSLRESRDAIWTDDIRGAFWVHAEIDEAERDRMAAVDRWLAQGSVAAGAPAWDDGELPKRYAKIRERGRIVSAAYQRRDAMLHEIPRVTETLLADAEAFVNQERSSPTSRLVARAISAAATLSDRLQTDDREPQSADWDRLAAAVAEADAATDALQARLAQRVESASGLRAADEAGLRQVDALLVGSGVSDPEARGALHRRLIELLNRDVGEVGRVDRADTARREPIAAEVTELIAIDGKPPWLAWLDSLAPDPDREPSTGETLDPATTFRTRIREFRSSPAGPDRDLSAILRTPAEQTRAGKPIAAVRRQLDELERQVRGRTILLGSSPPALTGVTTTRFAVDLQLALLLHAARTLDEFWCESVEGGPAFFTSAARRLMKPLIVDPELRLEPKVSGRDLRQLLAERRAAAEGGSTLRAEPVDRAAAPLYKLVAGQTLPLRLDDADRVPEGFAAVWSPDEGDASGLLGVGGTSDAATIEMKIPSDLPSDRQRLEVRTFFRGLRRPGGMSLRHLVDPEATVYRLPEHAAPEVVVSRDDPAPVPVVVVIDCSNSMNSPQGAPVARTRLGMARTAVRDFLAGHVDKGQITAGLVLFGHRFGWSLDEQSGNLVADGRDGEGLTRFKVFRMQGDTAQALTSKTLDSAAGENPNRDVESVIGLKRSPLSKDDFQDVVRLLDRVSAVGTTPTYQAVIEAYNMLGERDSGHVVVLTDGEPFLVGAGTREYGPRIDRLQRDFADRASTLHRQKPDVRLTFVNFKDRGESDDAVIRDLKRYFPQATFEPAIGGEELLDVLERSVRNPTAVWKRNAEPVSRRFDFAVPGRVDPWPPAGMRVEPGRPVRPAIPMEIEVDAGATGAAGGAAVASVRVEGGERFDLHLADGRLRHRPYAQLDLNVNARLELRGGDADRYDVFALLPDLNNNRGLTLPLVVQNRDPRAFTPRPVDAWVDLIGFNRDRPRGERVTYSISFPEYQSRQPVPVLLARVRDWPTWADRVQIRGWFRFVGPAAKRVDLSLDAPSDSESRQTLPDIDGVTFRVDRKRTDDGGVRVTVIEEYSADTSVHRLRLVTEPLPASAVVSHYPDEGVVERVFKFERPVEGLRVLVSDRAWIEEGAATNAESADSLPVDDR